MKIRMLTATLVTLGSASAYTLHEWGTFTSVSASDGRLLSGLDREEERLPSFVQALDGMQNIGRSGFGRKGFLQMRPLRNVTIKMETPVIYFYSDQAFKAKVEVGFDGGSISQWFPARSGGETPPPIPKKIPVIPVKATAVDLEKNFLNRGGIDFSKPYKGSIDWEVEVLAPDAPRGLSFKPGETLNWLRPRNPKANVLKVGDQYEDYLFYRGVGNFKLPVTFRVDASETLHIENSGQEKIPFLFVQEVTPDRKVRFYTMTDGLEASSSKTISETQFSPSSDKWRRTVYEAMSKGLLATGLSEEETNGMIQTWWHSYFEQPGLRVFWIVPHKNTAAILPLKVTPAPTETVRVLVGRSEVLRPRFERELLTNYNNRNDKEKRTFWARNQYHRYGKAFGQRVMQLVDDKITSAN